jgi:Ca2+-binding EF-hand superfamily protein
MKTKAAIIVLVIGAVAIPALAQSGPGRGQGRSFVPEFTELDVDGNGSISVEDLEAYRTSRFTAVDTDGDGSISRAEFIAERVSQVEERAGAMFDRLDADGDGALSQDAIAARRGGRGLDPERMIARFDADEDGVVSEEEFAAAIEQRAERRGERGGKRGHGQRRN